MHLRRLMRPAPVRLIALAALAALLAGCGGSSGHGSSGGASSASGSSVPGTATTGASAGSLLRAEILSPANGASVAAATSVTFTGRANGSSGSMAATLTWSSNIDGYLGTGSPLTTTKLSPGIHRIELEASRGLARDRSSIVLVVAGAPARPAQELLDYVKAIPGSIVGTPMKIPPDFMAMIDANPSDVNGIAGNGGISAGFSEAGTLTVLRYPSPASLDHVEYLSVPGRPKGTGALAGMGSFAGLVVTLPGGPVTTWLRDATWTRKQAYAGDGSPVLVTEHESAALGLRVRVEAFAHPTEDVLVQRYAIEKLAGSAVSTARLVFYENLSPCTFKIPYVPISDVHLDALNDFAVAYHEGDDALVHFRPDRPDFAALGAFAAQPHANLRADAASFVDSSDVRFGKGIYFAIGADRRSTGFQCGFDSNGLVRSGADQDAFVEANAGKLSGNPVAFVRANAALETPIDLASGSDAVTIYVAAGEKWSGSDGARERLRRARAATAVDHRNAAESDASAWLARARLPKPPADARTVAFAKRSLLVVRAATCRTTGAIVASIAGQLPYSADWPRDGAFINAALDVAGFPEVVEKHNDFYVKMQRQQGLWAGTWHMNFWADGTPAGPVPLEIDTTAFAVWSLAAHADRIADPVRRSSYLARVYPAIRKGADWLAAWRDPLTGLHLPANEDDNIVPTRTLHGAGPILLALRSAVTAGRAAGESSSVLSRLEDRALELERAIDKQWWDPSKNAWSDPKSGTAFNGGPSKASAWLLWPVAFKPFSDARVLSTADWIMDELRPVLSKQLKRSAYDPKALVSLAQVWRGDAAKTQQLRDALRTFTHELPIDGTLHVGEFYEVKNGRWTSLNDVPHVWEHVLVYHAAVELYP